MRVITPRGDGIALHPARPGRPYGPWVVVFDDGLGDVFQRDEIEIVEGDNGKADEDPVREHTAVDNGGD